MSSDSKQRSESLHARVARMMLERKLSQAELARRTGIERTTLSRFLRGDRPLRAAQIAWIAEVVGVPLHDLLSNVVVPEAAREVLRDFAEATQRAIAAETELMQARTEIEEMRFELARMQAEHLDELAERDRRAEAERTEATRANERALVAERNRADAERERAVSDEQQRGARALQSLKTETERLAGLLKSRTATLVSVSTELREWREYSGSLKTQLDAKAGEGIAIGLVAALGGLMIGGSSTTQRRRRRR